MAGGLGWCFLGETIWAYRMIGHKMGHPREYRGRLETFDCSLLTEIQFFEERSVAILRGAFKVIQKLAATSHQHEEAAAGVMIFHMRLKVSGELTNALCEESNLYIGAARIFIVKAKRLNVRGFCHKSLFKWGGDYVGLSERIK